MAKRWIIIIAAMAVLGLLIFFAFGRGDDAPDKLYGNVDIREVDLGFRVGGRIETMMAEEGDRIEAGASVARLDPVPLEEDVAAAKASVAEAAANLARLESGTRPQEIEQAEAQVAERKATLENTRRTLKRRQELAEGGAVSRQALDEAEARFEEARARLASAEEALRLAEEGFRSEEVAAGRAALLKAEAQLATAERRLADGELRAPTDGVILSRVREPGAIVPEGATVFTMAVENPVWVRAYVPEPQLGEVWPGREVSVLTDGGQTYAGQVGFVSPTAEFTPKNVQTEELRTSLVYRLRVVVAEADQGLRQGMPVTVTLGSQSQQQARLDD